MAFVFLSNGSVLIEAVSEELMVSVKKCVFGL
jgi:hypothetical protein